MVKKLYRILLIAGAAAMFVLAAAIAFLSRPKQSYAETSGGAEAVVEATPAAETGNMYYWQLFKRNGSDKCSIVLDSSLKDSYSLDYYEYTRCLYGTFYDTDTFTDATVPWRNFDFGSVVDGATSFDDMDITGFFIESAISPVSTAYWFKDFKFQTFRFSGFSRLSFSKVTDVSHMFENFDAYSLNDFDDIVSKVTSAEMADVSYLFANMDAGDNAVDLRYFHVRDEMSCTNMFQNVKAKAFNFSYEIASLLCKKDCGLSFTLYNGDGTAYAPDPTTKLFSGLSAGAYVTDKLENYLFWSAPVVENDYGDKNWIADAEKTITIGNDWKDAALGFSDFVAACDMCFLRDTEFTSNAYHHVPWGYGVFSLATGIKFTGNAAPVNMNYWFYSMSSLISVDFTNLNVENLVSVRGLFFDSNVETVDFKDVFAENHITNISSMFSFCTNLKSVDISNFYTGDVTDMRYLFRGCSSLESVSFGENFKTDKVVDYNAPDGALWSGMRDMFKDVGKLDYLDLSSFVIKGLPPTFDGLTGLKTLIAPTIVGDATITLPGTAAAPDTPCLFWDGSKYITQISAADAGKTLRSHAAHDIISMSEREATCTQTGIKQTHFECSICGKCFTDASGTTEITDADELAALIIPMKPHTLSDVQEVPATCTTEGVRAHQACSVCNKMFIDGEEVTDAELKITAGHTPVAEQENVVPSTCVAAGSCVEVVRCSVCNEELSRTSKVLPIDASAHYLSVVEEQAATCTQDGVKSHQNCSLCHKDFLEGVEVTDASELKIAAHHTFGTWTVTKQATCNEKGSRERTCSVCATKETEEIAIDPSAHAWDDGVVTTAATCSAKGEKTYTCAHDNTHTKTEEIAIDPSKHSLVRVDAKAATTEAEGNIEYWRCADCDKYFSDAEGKNEIADKSSVTVPKITPGPVTPEPEPAKGLPAGAIAGISVGGALLILLIAYILLYFFPYRAGALKGKFWDVIFTPMRAIFKSKN